MHSEEYVFAFLSKFKISGLFFLGFEKREGRAWFIKIFFDLKTTSATLFDLSFFALSSQLFEFKRTTFSHRGLLFLMQYNHLMSAHNMISINIQRVNKRKNPLLDKIDKGQMRVD